jgi:hypothetical protein
MDLNADAQACLNAGIKHIHYDCSQKWPLASNSLDVVFTSNFLEHLPDKEGIRCAVSSASMPEARWIHHLLRTEYQSMYQGPIGIFGTIMFLLPNCHARNF